MLPPDVSTSIETNSDVANLENVARVIAAAMDEDAVRSSVLNAMQTSNVYEHKLILQALLGRSSGQELRSAASAVAQEAGVSFGRLLQSLPGKMDFYVPVQSERRSWTGDGNVVVAAVMDPEATDQMKGFTPKGERISFSPSEADNVPGTLFVLHPAEPHVPNGPPAGENTIEATPAPSASADYIEPCTVTTSDVSTECGGGGGGGGGTDSDTYITDLAVDFGDGGLGNVEVYFKTCYTDGTNCVTSSEVSLPGYGTWSGSLKLHGVETTSTTYLRAHMREADSFLNGGDDDKGDTCLSINADYSCYQRYMSGDGAYVSYELPDYCGYDYYCGEYIVDTY